jgi:hypothetical protein
MWKLQLAISPDQEMEALIAQRKSCGFSRVEYHSKESCGSSLIGIVTTEPGKEQDPPGIRSWVFDEKLAL